MMMKQTIIAGLGAVAACTMVMAPGAAQAREREQKAEARQVEAANLPDSLPINRIQVLGTHNSYSLGVDPNIKAMLDASAPSMHSMLKDMDEQARKEFRLAHPNDVKMSEALNYSYNGLTRQLDLGARGLEIDINADPEGGAYADPGAYRILRAQGVTDLLPYDVSAMHAPGLKVLHMADIDFRASCQTFRACLGEMKTWSDKNPGHVPLFIMVEAKVSGSMFPREKPVPPFTDATYDEMDRTILDVIGREKIITPDDVRGHHTTLEQGVLAGNWPKLGDARGKFLFMLSTATGKDGASAYLNNHPGLKGRVAFLDSTPGQDHAAFILDDNALVRGKEIKDLVSKGYLVRSRADIETYEAKMNDMTRAKAAFDTGAQIISTDFIEPGNAYGTPYVVKLPGGDVARAVPLPKK